MPKTKESNQDFYKILQQEKLQLQSQRFKYVITKLSFVSGLLGVGLLKLKQLNFVELFLIIPLLCIIYDLYIYGADYTVKKIGAFLMRSKDISQAAKDWHKEISLSQNYSAFIANHLITLIVTISSIFLYFYNYEVQQNNLIIILCWYGLLLLIEAFLCYYQKEKIRGIFSE
jgi:hypothetical protein